ncbi:MAG: fibronectin type III domain-containing protein [Chitinophagaceae bacterium]|nr:fibronectin type III domain-containing protein [Chitinophagaceae bacterium]
MKYKLHLLASAFLLSFTHLLSAQSLIQWQWQQLTNVTYTDIEYKDNFLYAVGNFTDSAVTIGSNTYVNAGGSDIIICKMDTLGTIIWSQHFGSSNNESLKSICIDNNDNVLAVGAMQNSLAVGSNNLTSVGGKDMLLIKCSSSGAVLLAKNVGTVGDDEARDVTTDYLNDIYVVGSKATNNMVFAGTNNIYTNAILKYSSSGNEVHMRYMKQGNTSSAATGGTELIKYSPYDSTIIICGEFITGSNTNSYYSLSHSSNISISIAEYPSPSWGALNRAYFCKTSLSGNVQYLYEVGDSYLIDVQDFTVNPQNGDFYFTQWSHYPLSQINVSTWNKSNPTLSTFSVLPISLSNNAPLNPSDGNPIKINYQNNMLYGLHYQVNLFPSSSCTDYYSVKFDLSNSTSEFKNLNYGQVYTAGVGFNGAFCMGSKTTIAKSCSTCPVLGYTLNQAPDVSICANASVNIGLPQCYYALGGTPPYTFSWQPAIGLSSTTSPLTSVNGLTSTTTYTLTVTDASMNVLFDTVTVNVIPNPTITYSFSPSAPFCVGDTVNITYSGAQNYHLNPWNGTQYLSNPHTVVVHADTVFELAGSLNGCTSWIRPQLLTFQTNIQASKVVFCEGDSIQIKAMPGTSFSWQPGASTGDSIWVYPTANTTYTVTATHANGCTATSTIDLFSSSSLSSTASPSTLCLGNSVSLTASGQGYNLGSNTVPTGYCTPTCYGTFNGAVAISGFKLEQLYNYNTNYANIYTDYSGLTIPTVMAGSSYTIGVNSSNDDGMKIGIWIDYNQDGSFNGSNEFLGQTLIYPPAISGSIPLTINTNALPGLTKMRILTGGNSNIQSTSSCNYNGYGEYEDYVIRIGKLENLYGFTWTGGTTPISGPLVNATPNAVGNQLYGVSVNDFNGCSVSNTVTVNALNVDTVYLTENVCSNLLPFVWNGQSLNTSGTYDYLSTNTNGCDSLTILTLNVLPSNPPITTNVTACDSFTWPANGVTYTLSGTYTATVLNPFGCSQTDTLILTINTSTSNTSAVSDCLNYTWLCNNNTYTQSGTYTCTSTNASGCTHTETLLLTLGVGNNSTQNITTCVSYTWSCNGISYTQSGNYTCINGCDTTTLNLIINPLPMVTAPPVSYCSGSVVLGGTPAGGTWNLPNPYTGNATSYTYYYTDVNGCSGSATGTISQQQAMVSNIQLSNITGVSATANWTGNASWYEIRYKAVSASNWNPTSTSSATNKTLIGLLPNTNYTVQVRGFCTGSTPGPWVGTSFFTNNGCGTPSGLSVSNVTATTTKLNWVTVAGASYYKVRHRKVGTTSWINGTTTPNFKTIGALLPTTNYEFQVQAVCGSSLTAWSASQTWTTAVLREEVPLENTNSSEIKVYPTITSDNIHIEIPVENTSMLIVKVSDLSGRILKQFSENTDAGLHHVNLDLSELAQGIYVLEILNGNEKSYITRVIKK